MDLQDDHWMDLPEAASYLKTTPTSLARRCRRGYIPEQFYGRFGREFRFKKAMLDKLIASGASH